jgi:hypothetical protein
LMSRGPRRVDSGMLLLVLIIEGARAAPVA